MEDAHDHGPILLVACALCDRLHEPRSVLDSNSVCAGCSEALTRMPLPGLASHPASEDEL